MDRPRKGSRGIAKLVRLNFGLPHARRGDTYRMRGDWIEAVLSYRRALEWMPWREDLKIQIGNCLREFGDLNGAIAAYQSVSANGDRAEALRQIAETNRREGFTIHSYLVGSSPMEEFSPASEWNGRVEPGTLPNRIKFDINEPRRWLGSLGHDRGKPRRKTGNVFASIKLDQVGALSMEREGLAEPLFAGVVALRGRVLAIRNLDTVQICLGEGEKIRIIATVPTRLVEIDSKPLKLHVFNAWIDSASLPFGRHWLSVRAAGKIEPAGLFVNVTDRADAAAFATSNAFVLSRPTQHGPCDAYVEALPAIARKAARTLFDQEIRTILVMRADQLGDLSASLPSFARLRSLFPNAHISALVQPGLSPIVEASAMVDDVLTIDLSYDHQTERRYLETAEEDRVRRGLTDRHFDLAIDLSTSDETRTLLLLAEATYVVGFNPDRFPFLDFGISIRSRDKINQLEKNPHAVNVLALVEALAVALTPSRPPVPRRAASEPVLRSNGLAARGYIVIHTGARHAINKWPSEKFLDLSRLLLRRTQYDVVVFYDSDDAKYWHGEMDSRLHLYGRIDTDTFDAIVSNAALMIANDSGPKHLATTRGVNTVSLHVGRLNWNEWGQDGIGTILSKRVPCTGCGLNDVALCGRDAVCIRSISVTEVLDAVAQYIKINC